ncbi:hypothetical protein EDB81DRAFT_654462 [Dactylonectria macrodidyma]|uniref:Zn(2)-C6 fungal-type domain-containing protein n=1 Tax=Dactylonectria macrodidyma TaxID=307937 RepID=A0A9P9EQ31_9HYPO|nr:hypothetical protein EDB81DRAFT_654462 [Dactylonectria macrodidyma]
MDEHAGPFGNRSGPRSRTGCLTCRGKKVKCDETRPVCLRCARLSRTCDWTQPPRKTPSRRPFRPRVRGSYPSPNPATPCPCPCPPQASESSACGLELDSHCHEAIALYQTLFAVSVDTKNPAYSLPAIILTKAASAPSVMNMVLAIGHQLSTTHSARKHPQEHTTGTRSLVAVDHYCQALQLLGEATVSTPGALLDLDVILATVWLMAVYEQRFGEQPIPAITAHFRGVAAALKMVNLGELARTAPDGAGDYCRTSSSSSTATVTATTPELSCLGARILLFLVNMDARVACRGFRGILNTALAESVGDVPWPRVLVAVHEKSYPLHQVAWGDDYPTAEILYDIEHKSAFDLLRDTSQLRLLIAELSWTRDSEQKLAKLAAIHVKIQALRRQHAELFIISERMLDSDQNLSPGLATTLCWVIPHYHLAALHLLRIATATDHHVTDNQNRRATCSQSILQLAMRGFQREGAPAIVRIALPLFLAGLETCDAFRQQWAVDRLRELSRFGPRYEASALLLKELQARRLSGARTEQDSDLLQSILSEQVLM